MTKLNQTFVREEILEPLFYAVGRAGCAECGA
jgi:hypothetical protein